MSKIDLRIRNNNKLHSIILNDYRIGGCKWNDIEHGECIEYPVNKEDIVIALGIDKTIADLQSQLDQANERLKGAIIPRYAIGTKLYMIPTEFNRLKGIKDYELLSISLSSIGLRYDLSLNKKEKGVEPFYCASEDMFGQSIFSTLEEAEKKLQELRNGVFSGE